MKDQAIQCLAMDVHQATTVVCVRDERGTIVMTATVPTEAKAIIGLVRGAGTCVHVAFEEGTRAQWVHDLLQPCAERASGGLQCQWQERSGKQNRPHRRRPALGAATLGSLKTVYHGAASMLVSNLGPTQYLTLPDNDTVMLRLTWLGWFAYVIVGILVGTIGIVIARPTINLQTSDVAWILKTGVLWYGGLGFVAGAMLEGSRRGRRVFAVAGVSCLASIAITFKTVHSHYPIDLESNVFTRLSTIAVGAVAGILIVYPLGTWLAGAVLALWSKCRVCDKPLTLLQRYPSTVKGPDAVCETCFEIASLDNIRTAQARASRMLHDWHQRSILALLSRRVAEIPDRLPPELARDPTTWQRIVASVVFEGFRAYVDRTMLQELENMEERKQLIDRFLRWTSPDGYMTVVAGLQRGHVHDFIVAEWRRKSG